MRSRKPDTQNGNAPEAPGAGASGHDFGECEESRSLRLNLNDLSPTDKCRALVPAEKEERNRLRTLAREYAAAHRLVPPLSLEALERHAEALCADNGISAACHDFATVLIGNALWEGTLAGVPFPRRLLLLPQCLRDRATCPAVMDEFGLLCEDCGRCAIGKLLAEAENLGYVTLVAEGTRMVAPLLERGLVDAVVGVGCLSSLERLFPSVTAAALPGVAIPLVRDGCDRTAVDLDWVRDAVRLRSERPAERFLDLEALKTAVRQWFEDPSLLALLQPNATGTEKIACEWLLSGGKRWRPYLLASAYLALRGGVGELPETVRRLAVAVECFHKASLAHDDIEDDDDSRYGSPALHRQHGLPVALNAGDLLVGEGYRLIAESGADPALAARLLSAAVRGHRDLCLGQGEELLWTGRREPLPLARVLDIFRRKTAPAFEVALVLGALCAGADDEVCRVLRSYSTALGIAYQIRDDLDDFTADGQEGDLAAGRPTVVTALAWELARGEARAELESLFRERGSRAGRAAFLEKVRQAGAGEAGEKLLDHFRQEAFRTLEPLQNSILKRFLFQVAYRMLGVSQPARREDEAQAADGPWRDMDTLREALGQEISSYVQ